MSVFFKTCNRYPAAGGDFVVLAFGSQQDSQDPGLVTQLLCARFLL